MNGNLISTAVLILSTAYFGYACFAQKRARTWAAFFFTFALATAIQGLYKNFDRFHVSEFWTVVSCLVSATSLLFLAACVCSSRPQWKWLHWFWPLVGLGGILAGGFFAALPSVYLLVVASVCIILSVFILIKAKSSQVRHWIFAGLFFCGAGWAVQGLAPTAFFHWFALVGNYCFWQGAKRTFLNSTS